jgi:hypothetical protein
MAGQDRGRSRVAEFARLKIAFGFRVMHRQLHWYAWNFG